MKTKSLIFILSLISITVVGLFINNGMNINNYQYVLSIRIPQVLAIILTGVAISFSTLLFQTISNNRILTPSMLGLDSLYILVQTVIVFLLGSTSIFTTNPHINFFISTLIMVIASLFMFKYVFYKVKNNLLLLLLIGTIASTLFRSISSFLQMIIDPNEFLTIQNKMFASFNNINTTILLLVLIIVLLIIPFVYDDIPILDVIALGKDQAINLGIDHKKFVSKSLIIIALLIAVSTALVGPLTFFGLLVVNFARELLKTYKHTYIVIVSMLLSIILLVGGQWFVESVLNFMTPLSVIVNFAGGVYIIYILLKENRV